MSRVLFNPYKGYSLARGNQGQPSEDEDPVLTDGFDKLNWSLDRDHQEIQHQEYAKSKRQSRGVKSSYDILDSNHGSREGTPDSMYENESKSHMNAESSLNPRLIEDNSDAAESDTNRKGKKKTKKKELKSKSSKPEKKSKKQKRNKHDELDVGFEPSDPDKVKLLHMLYNQLIITKTRDNDGKKPRDDDKIFQFFDVTVYKEDLDNLKDDEWLSDNNISFIYEYLERYQLLKHPEVVSKSIQLLRPSMVYLLANVPNPEELKGVIPPLEKAKFIFLPVNDNDDVEAVEAGSHWSLVVISILDNTAYVYDTLERANEKEALEVIERVSKYLNNGTTFQVKIIESTPQQKNGSDCGIMVGQLTGFLLSRLLDLEHLGDHCVNFGMKNVSISAIDGRIFIMGTLLNILKHKILEVGRSE